MRRKPPQEREQKLLGTTKTPNKGALMNLKHGVKGITTDGLLFVTQNKTRKKMGGEFVGRR